MKNNRNLRWYIVSDGDELSEIISAYSHSRAKIQMYCNIWGMGDTKEALVTCSASLVKPELDEAPEKEGQLYLNYVELLRKGVYDSAWTNEPCKSCGKICDEGNPQYYNEDQKKFYCDSCK